MKILAVDTCLGACSVAILDGEKTLAHRFELMDREGNAIGEITVADLLAGKLLTL